MKGKKHILTENQERWLIDNYADTKNADCLAYLGLAPNAWRSLCRIAARLGLEKSPDFMRNMLAEATRRAAIANEGGNAGAANLLTYGIPFRFKKGVSNRERLGDEKDDERLRKAHASRNETIRKERIRIKWGLEQRTNLKLVREPHNRVCLRTNFRKKGYIVPHRGAKTVYYDNATERSAIMERKANKQGFKILPYNNQENDIERL